jgi:hypothetical protein
MIRILIAGGYGNFGGRIVRLLETEPRLTLIVAGRSLARAEAFCRARGNTAAKLVPAMFDRDGDLMARIAALRPDILVDASGPFQTYGYRVIEACIASGVHYLDLADGSDFVAGVGAFDNAAREAGLFILSGVSSCPVLTAAAVRRMSSDLTHVDAIRGGIAPSPLASVGENVVRAIASYAGRPVRPRRDGTDATGYPFTSHMRFTIAPPGRIPLRNRLFSLVDVPDLWALPALWPEVRTVWFGAAPVPVVSHRALIALAWLVRLRLIPSLSPLVPLMRFAMSRLRWGEHRGGMFVEIEGATASGQHVKRSWHLLAEGDDGPFIPAMGVAAAIRRVLDGRAPPAGARAATGDLELEDYEILFRERSIYTGIRNDTPIGPLYQRLLGTAWEDLPPEIRTLHDTSLARGRASVERGKSLLSRLTAKAVGFPPASPDIEVSVRFDPSRGGETWTRIFGQDRFSSRQFAGHGRSAYLLCERFGPLTFAMALVPDRGRLLLVLRGWSVLGFPLPMWLCPHSTALETVADGRFRFHVEISHFLTGLIVRYQGWLDPRDSC